MISIISTTLADIMTRGIIGVTPETSIAAAAKLMAERHISSLLVTENETPCGIVTEHNLVRAAHNRHPGQTPIRNIMSAPLITAHYNTTIFEASKIAERHGIRHLIVIDDASQAIGMVSDTDFRMHLGTAVFRHLRTLEGVMERHIPQLSPEASLADGIANMIANVVDYLMICQHGKPLGILTERDIPRLLHGGANPQKISLGDVMSAPVHSISPLSSVTNALEAMTERRVRHMAVVDASGHILGVISQRRLFERMALEQFETVLHEVQQEHEQRRQQAHMQLALDAARAGTWEYRYDTRRRQMSDSLLSLIGRTVHDAPYTGAEWSALVHPEDYPQLKAAVDKLRSPDMTEARVEYRVRHQQGHWLWIEDRGCIIERNKQGRPLASAGIVTDISQRRLERAALDNERGRLRALLRTLPDMVWLKSPEGVFLDCNPQAARLIDASPEALIGRRDSELIAPDQSASMRETDQLAIAKGDTVRYEKHLRFPDGHEELNEISKTPVYDTNNQLIGILGIAHNITEREGNRERIAHQNRTLRIMSGIAQALVRRTDEAQMLAEVCTIIVEVGGYRMAWVGEAGPAPEKAVIPRAHSGHEDGYLETLDLTWGDPADAQGAAGRAIRTGIPSIIQNLAAEAGFARWHQAAKLRGYAGVVALPLRNGGQIFGTLSIYADRIDAFDDDEMALLSGVASELGLGMSIQRSRQALAASEAQLRRSEASLREAQRLAHLGSWMMDLESGQMQASDEIMRMFEQPSNPPLTRKILMAQVVPEDRTRIEQAWQEARKSRSLDCEYRIRSAGKVCWVRERAEMRRDASGAPRHAFGTIQDITERREFQEELLKLSLAIEQSPHSIIITNIDAEIEYVNQAFVNTSGYTREEVIRQNPKLLQSGLSRKGQFDTLWETLHRGEIWRGEFSNRRKDGSTYDEFAIISPVRQQDGRITHYLAIKEDITEKKQNQAELERYRQHLETLVTERTLQLEQAKEIAESANQAKSAFLANMSHEIRTPLNAIIGLSHLALRQAHEPEQQARLNKVNDAAHHLLSIINDVLDISKIEAGKLELENTDFSMRHVFTTALGLISERAQAKQLRLSEEIDPALPARLRGDPLRIQQIMVNFLSNAVKFTEQGGIAMRAQLLSREGRSLRVRCSITDSGIGIADDIKGRLFQPFEQADSSTTRRYGGTGLGLAISRRLTEAMHGEIGVDSTPGRGSTFWFTVRLEEANALPSESAHTSADDVRQASSARILLAEDNEVNAEVATELLRSAGLRVDHAQDGIEAVELARRHHYDLVLMDMQMPGMDGLSATRAIRALPNWAAIPILAITANAFEDDRDACLAAGMNDHVAKPVTPGLLFGALARWLPKPLTQPLAPDSPTPGAAANNPRGLDKIAGLDAEFGLHSVRGRVETYHRLLGKFFEHHVEDFSRIRQCLEQDEQAEAQRLAHSLKGAAATLGITRVQQSAAALELAIRENRPENLLTPLIDRTFEDFQALSASILAVLNADGPEANGTPSIELKQLLEKVEKELREGDISVQETVRQQAAALHKALGDRYPLFERFVSAFAFEEALALLTQSNTAS